jgi:hypothetical protein
MRNPIAPADLAAARVGLRRSPEWPQVERAHLQAQPRCLACAAGAPDTAVQVHHIFPFHLCILFGRPDLELDARNLITLCESEPGRPAADHHLLLGHLDDFESANLDVLADAQGLFHGMSARLIRVDPRWRAKEMVRVPALERMSRAQKAELARQMNARFPVR